MKRAAALLLVLLSFAACASRGGPGALPAALVRDAVPLSRQVKHVVIVVQENRSFDDLFATFPGADGARYGRLRDGTRVPLARRPLLAPNDMLHDFQQYRTAYDGGRMDGFEHETFVNGFFVRRYPYQYVDPAQIAPYWTLAKRYVLADRTFTTQGSDSFTAHQDLIAGGTQISKTASVVDAPTGQPWGCDAPRSTVTSLIDRNDAVMPYAGPFPCFRYPTLRDLLDAAGVSWRYYDVRRIDGWNAFEAIAAVRYDREWQTNIATPQTAFFDDVAAGRLAQVTWIVPQLDYSDHPGALHDYGPSWVADVVNAIGESPYWRDTVVIVVWDDWGGFYDHVPPPQLGFGGLGFRVPMIVAGAYARSGYVAHEQYEFGSVLRFVEDAFGLGRLGTSDVRANSLRGVFDFARPARPYVPVHASQPPSFFRTLRSARLPYPD